MFCNDSRPVFDGAWYWLDTCTRYAPLSLRLPDRAVRSRSVQFVLAGFAQVSMPRPRRPAWRGRPDIGLAKEKATAVLAQVRPLGLGLGRGAAQPAPQGPPREAKIPWPVLPQGRPRPLAEVCERFCGPFGGRSIRRPGQRALCLGNMQRPACFPKHIETGMLTKETSIHC